MYICSTAIMKYICQKYSLPDHWYPKDLQRKARVEEALSWFPMNLRCQTFLFSVSLYFMSNKVTVFLCSV